MTTLPMFHPGTAGAIALGLAALAPVSHAAGVAAAARPNILWLTSEDHGIEMGCYGDTYATTPNVDALAARGLTYRFAWSNAPVCAPARTTIISGMYPTSTGSEHMRSLVACPRGLAMYPQLLREAGFYCTNNVKEDYNLAHPGQVWDESSNQAHWKNRPAGKPFFAIFNSTRSHESQVRRRPHELKHDPAHVRVPAYHPDTPEVRRDWAQYHDVVSEADADAGRRLEELAAAGLAEDTIVFYYGDHGSGLPRSKRWPGNSGLRVPLVVYIPGKFADLRPPDYAPGVRSDRLVSFVDLAPTLLSLAGVAPPDWMQGRAFLGRHIAPAPDFLHGFRGRMDERNDLVRSVTDGRYVYLRNYLPHRPAGQHVSFQFETPTTQVWRQWYLDGRLMPEQAAFWNRRAAEELYDLQTDPDEVRNLADSADHREVKARLRTAQQAQARVVRDVGFLPEGELFTRRPGTPPYDFAKDPAVYPFERIFAMAETASMLEAGALLALINGLSDTDSAVRYWAALGLLMREAAGVRAARAELRRALADDSPHVRVVVAEALARHGDEAERTAALAFLGEAANPAESDVFVACAALNALEALGPLADPVRPALAAFPKEASSLPAGRYGGYVTRLLDKLLAP